MNEDDKTLSVTLSPEQTSRIAYTGEIGELSYRPEES